MRSSDWSSDVCSSDLHGRTNLAADGPPSQCIGTRMMVFEIVDQALKRIDCLPRGAEARLIFLRRPGILIEIEPVKSLTFLASLLIDENVHHAVRHIAVVGSSVSVRVGIGGRRIIKNKK